MIRRLISSVLISLIIVLNIQIAYASDSEIGEAAETIDSSNSHLAMTSGLSDLEIQLDELYKEVGKQLDINYIYVKMIHLIAGGEAIYADRRPNIYTDVTVDNLEPPLDINGAYQSYEKKAHWAYCPDPEVQRPSKYYLPDALFSVSSDIVALMNKRAKADRGDMQHHFNNLHKESRRTLIFAEAMLEYTNSNQSAIDGLFSIYTQISYDKEKYENVIYANEDRAFKFKEKHIPTILENGIQTDRELELLAIVFAFDGRLAASVSEEILEMETEIPYRYGYTSRENMMIAAASVAGKVRYVWGGGHLGAGSIEGINPMWKSFYDSYPDHGKETGGSIIPNYSVCPIHGVVEDDPSGCLFQSPMIYSVEEYLKENKDIIATSAINEEQLNKVLSKSPYIAQGIVSHRLDGLDCSGFASWLYTQIDENNSFSSGATSFMSQVGIEEIEYGSDLLPGDLFSWGEHIVIVVGAVSIGSRAYVIIESSPITVQYSIIYYSDATEADIYEATITAKEANALIAGLGSDWVINRYNIDKMGYYYTDTPIDEQYDYGSWVGNSINLEAEWTSLFMNNLTEIQEETPELAREEAMELAYRAAELQLQQMLEVETGEETDLIKEEQPLDKLGEGLEDTRELERYVAMGRLKSTFVDEYTIIPQFDKTMKSMTAREIIQNTVDKLGIDYLSGALEYEGEIFTYDRPERIIRIEPDGSGEIQEVTDDPVLVTAESASIEKLDIETEVEAEEEIEEYEDKE